MAKFEIEIKELHQIWEALTFSVEAENEEEAIKLAKDAHTNGTHKGTYELLIDTTDPLSPSDIDGGATFELRVNDELKETNQDNSQQYISVIWRVEDVIDRAKVLKHDLSREKAWEALKDIKKNHDCQFGVTYDTLDYYIRHYGTEKKKGVKNGK